MVNPLASQKEDIINQKDKGMDLKTLRGDLQKIVAVNASNKSLTIDLALGLIGAYIFQTVGNSLSGWLAMNTFLTYLRSGCFKGKKKSIITESSFADCVSYIRNYILEMPFEKKKGTLLSLELKVITGVEESGYISFNNITFESYASQKTINGKSSQNYVVDATINMIDEEIEDVSTEIEQGESTINSDNDSSGGVEILKAEKKPRNQNSCTDNSPFIQLYDNLMQADYDIRNKAKYSWQWFLTIDEYYAIKDCIEKNKIPRVQNWDIKTVCLLVLFIGEFYKREYDDDNKALFAQFGENSPNSKFRNFDKICDFLDIEPYRRDNQAHLFTLYVNGGLPVHYISTKLDDDKTNSLIDGLSKLLDTEDDIGRIEGEESLERVNTALKGSYQNKHSIYEYIQALLLGKETWNELDNDSSDFIDFKEKIKEANKKTTERKKFKILYSLWTYLDNSNIKEFYITPQLRFNPEEDGERHYAISEQRLTSWGIKNPPAQFSLIIGENNIIFTICANGDYISRDMVDRIDLPVLDKNLKIEDLSNPDYAINYDDLTGETYSLKKDFYHPFKDGFIQFYTDDDPSMASWDSFKGAKSFLWSGLLYNKSRYCLLSPISTIDINENFGWVSFRDSVSFEDTSKGKIHTFYNSKGKIYAKPTDKSIHEGVKNCPLLLEGCMVDGKVECTIGNEKSYAYIVKSENLAFDIYRSANDEKIDFMPIIEYKVASDYVTPSTQWVKYDSTELDQGFYVFRLIFAGYVAEVKCYILPAQANITFQNTSKPYQIKFNGFANVISEGIAKTQRNNSIVFNISDERDYYSFTLGNQKDFVTLKTLHPKPQTHVYLYGQEIIEKPIIIAYADEIEVKYISANTSKNFRLFEEEKIYKRLFEALTATAMGKGTDLLINKHNIQIDEKDKKSILPIRVYTQNIPITNNSVLKINESNNMMLLDLEDNTITPFDSIKQNMKNPEHDSLLFQSLKDVNYPDDYYAPKFLSHTGQGAKNNVKRYERQRKLTKYANKDNPKSFVSDFAYQQFEIACEHKLYFAFSDPLLGMCWDVKNKAFLDVTKSKFKKNLLCFLQGYIDYTNKKSIELSVTGLRRLAREFLFDWVILKKDIKESPSQQLKEIYQEIVSN